MSSFPQIGFHCSTRQHLDLAIDFIDPNRISYSNACWTRNALNHAQSNNVEFIGFDSESELAKIAKAGIKNKLILNIRFNETEDQSGCEVSEAPELLLSAANFGLECVGIGFNVCSQRPARFESMVECASQLFDIGLSMGLQMNVLNLGNGFPSIFSSSTHGPSFQQISEQLNTALDYYFPASSNVEIMATPGEFFASPIFSLATKIIEKTEMDASEITNDDFDIGRSAYTYKITEGYYGPFNCQVMPNCEAKCLPLFANMSNNSNQLCYGSVIGPTEDEFDVVQKQCQLREMNVGEWLFWPNMGSYSMNNCDSLDIDDPCTAPEVHYFSKETDWKYSTNESNYADVMLSSFPNSHAESEGESDGEESIDSAIEVDEDPFWLFNLGII